MQGVSEKMLRACLIIWERLSIFDRIISRWMYGIECHLCYLGVSGDLTLWMCREVYSWIIICFLFVTEMFIISFIGCSFIYFLIFRRSRGLYLFIVSMFLSWIIFLVDTCFNLLKFKFMIVLLIKFRLLLTIILYNFSN